MSLVEALSAERHRFIAIRELYIAEMQQLMGNAAASLEPLSETDGALFDRLMADTKALETMIERLWLQESAHRDHEVASVRDEARAPKPKPKPAMPKVQAPAFECNCATCRGEPYVEEPPQLPLPVMPLREGGQAHYLVDEIERRARAMQQWGPWGDLNRRRRSRRYEGFGRGQRW